MIQFNVRIQFREVVGGRREGRRDGGKREGREVGRRKGRKEEGKEGGREGRRKGRKKGRRAGMIQERRKDLEIQTHTAMLSICRVLHVRPLCLTVILQARNGGKHTAPLPMHYAQNDNYAYKLGWGVRTRPLRFVLLPRAHCQSSNTQSTVG